MSDLFEMAKNLVTVQSESFKLGRTDAGFKAGVKAGKGTFTMKLIVNISDGAAPVECSYSCVDDNYEPGDIQGFGRTEMDAIEDYIEQWHDRYDDVHSEEEPRELHENQQTGNLE